jgi:Flp pilus assembly protein TadG
VELALVTPLLGGLLLGVCELGQALRAADILAEASRNACAYASRPGGSNANALSEVQTALANARLPSDSVTVTVLVNGVAADAGSANANDQITVTVSIPWSRLSITGTSFYLPSGSIQSGTTVMLKQG